MRVFQRVVEDSFLVGYGAASLGRVFLTFCGTFLETLTSHHHLNNVSACSTRITYAAKLFVCCHRVQNIGPICVKIRK
jgi:hypothetical protein